MLYAESSAVIAWLFGEPSGPVAADVMRAADAVVTSDLTLIECDRALLRAEGARTVGGDLIAAARRRLVRESALWGVLPISVDVIARARASFPDDAIRTLDAIHLATAVIAASAMGGIDVLSLDERIRANARALGFQVVPD